MASDVIVLEDSEEFLYVLSKFVERQHLTPRAFIDPADAMAHLISRTAPPAGYLVDMRNVYDLSGPEEFYRAVSGRGWMERFYFVTSNYSPYDDAVIKRTGATWIGKHDLDSIEKIINAMAAGCGRCGSCNSCSVSQAAAQVAYA